MRVRILEESLDRARGLALVDTYVRVHTVYIHSLHGNYYTYIYIYSAYTFIRVDWRRLRHESSRSPYV